jgi:hypothetical protein
VSAVAPSSNFFIPVVPCFAWQLRLRDQIPNVLPWELADGIEE